VPVQPTTAAPTEAIRRRNPWLTPLVVSSATLAVLVTAIVVAVVRSHGATTATPCPVGTWTVTRYTESVAVAGVGDVTFAGSGTEIRLRADGTGVTDYRTGTRFVAQVGEVSYELVVTGRISYAYRIVGDQMRFSDVRADGRETVTRRDTGESLDGDLVGTMDPATVRCGGTAMTQSTSRYTAELRRVNATG
jgi:hypothetical protein